MELNRTEKTLLWILVGLLFLGALVRAWQEKSKSRTLERVHAASVKKPVPL